MEHAKKRRLDSKIVEDITFRNEKFNVEPKRNSAEILDPWPFVSTHTDIEELTDSLQCLPMSCGFLHLLSKPSEVSHSEHDTLPLISRNVKAKINHEILKVYLAPSFECLHEFGKSFISEITPTDLQQDLIEKKTRLQTNSARWHEERYCRPTASNFGKVIQRKSEF